MQPFVLDSRGRLVFPSNVVPQLDLTAVADLDQLTAAIHRDFEAKAPSGTTLLARIEAGDHYTSRRQLMRDVALNLFWSERFALTLYEKRPTRWKDVPRSRGDVFLPELTPWVDAERKVAAVATAHAALPVTGPAEDHVFDVLFDVLRDRRFHATELPAVPPTVGELLERPDALTYTLGAYDPDYPVYSTQEILDCAEDDAELEALHRWAMVLHDQFPWDRSAARLTPVGELRDDDHVVVLHPRSREVADFLRRARTPRPARVRETPPAVVPPVAPYPPLRVRERFAVQPRIEAIAAVKGEHLCTNDDIIRNSAWNWSPMTAQQILDKTGIASRVYTERPLEEIALDAARAALAHAGRGPEEIGAVLFCSCTATRLMPSTATWIAARLGIAQTHSSCDIVAACAGLPYGLTEAVRVLQEVERPVLLVCGEKFSDKIGSVRPSRMIFGDAAAAIVVAPAAEGEPTDVEVLQTYAGGPVNEVDSIVWPNPEYDNNVTVYGPDVRSLAGRYLGQMLGELREQGLLDDIELIVPHQANKTMVLALGEAAGLTPDQLYFNIETVGNTSACSIPLALADAVADGVIKAPTRVFSPGFGAGAVGGYAVLRIDPAVIAPSPLP